MVRMAGSWRARKGSSGFTRRLRPRSRARPSSRPSLQCPYIASSPNRVAAADFCASFAGLRTAVGLAGRLPGWFLTGSAVTLLADRPELVLYGSPYASFSKRLRECLSVSVSRYFVSRSVTSLASRAQKMTKCSSSMVYH